MLEKYADKKMNVKKEINLPANQYVDRAEKLSDRFLNISCYTLLESIPEMLSEWWTASKQDIPSFSHNTELSKIITEKDFIDIVVGKYYFSNTFMMLIKEKIPYKVTFNTLYHLIKLPLTPSITL